MDMILTHKHGKQLKQQFMELCNKSSELKILVGFFYFSGIRALYDALTASPQIKLRILVGMEVETIFNRVVECILDEADDFGQSYSYSDNEIRERYMSSLRKAANAPEFDKESFHGRIGYFLEMLRADRIIIRKTRAENREKLFIFDLDGNKELMAHCAWITGSSNFTMPGLSTETDIDVRINDCGCEEVNMIFDELWSNSVTLTEDPPTKQKILDLFEKESMLSPVTPFEAYILALKNYLDIQTQVNVSERLEKLLEQNGYKKYKYQLDAVNQALTILKEYNGVIIADVVGLGKSVIASMVARGTYKRGIIIAPPGLIGNESKAKGGWRDYKSQFKLDGWEVFSCGLLEAALDYVNRDGDIDVVIIDEAHRFKNQDTQDYETLCNICRGRQVIMLTATPFNNRPADIFSLLKLFIIPNRSKITLDNHLANRFAHYDRMFRLLGDVQKHHRSTDPQKVKKAEQAFLQLSKYFTGVAPDGDMPIDLRLVKEWSQILAREIRHILEPVIIRRNRIDLRNDPDYKNEVTELSDMMPPVEQFYDLSPEQSKFYDEVLNEYFGEEGRFNGAIYRPFVYEQSVSGELDAESNRELNQQTNLYDFMRRLLVRRFESSFGAFAQSIENFLAVHRKAEAFIDKTGKFILDRNLLEKIYEADDDLIEEELNRYEEMLETKVLPKNNKVYQVDSFSRKNDFIADVESDIRLFEELIERMKILTLATKDPKAACLARALFSVVTGTHESLVAGTGEPARKVIVFSEYADTIRHLSNYLEAKLPGKIITAVGSISAKAVSDIERNFDASFKGEQKDDYQILLATDKMSEGHNLNRAGLVVNYDIPWNPTRVIQRVGRINRIGKKVFQQLYIFNFFPTEVGATIAKSREIAAAKMFMIHNSIGEDAQIFDIDETPTASSLYHKLQQRPEDAETESFLTSVKKELAEAKQTHPEIFERIKHLPYRIKTAKAASANELILFKRKGLGLFSLQVDESENMKTSQIPVEDALQKLRCPFEEPRLELGNVFWKAYDLAGKYQETFSGGTKNAQSLETKARNNVVAAITFCEKENRYDILRFLRTVLEDIRQYGSLPDYTLRKLAQHDLSKDPDKVSKFLDAVEVLRETLGDFYLVNLKTRLNYKNSEIIIAAELQAKN